MAGKLCNWARGKILQDMSNIASWTPPASLDMYCATDSYDADGTGTQVPGSAATPVANDNTVFSQTGSGPLENGVSAITTAVRATGGDQTVVSVLFVESGQPTHGMWRADLTTPVVWPQGQAVTIPIADLTVDILTT
jgi:hypothetical protein